MRGFVVKMTLVCGVLAVLGMHLFYTAMAFLAIYAGIFDSHVAPPPQLAMFYAEPMRVLTTTIRALLLGGAVGLLVGATTYHKTSRLTLLALCGIAVFLFGVKMAWTVSSIGFTPGNAGGVVDILLPPLVIAAGALAFIGALQELIGDWRRRHHNRVDLL